jgi:ABC-type xylose transport system permease subunit
VTKVRFEVGNKWRFGPDWPGHRCGAKTRKGTPCQRPAKLPVGRCRLVLHLALAHRRCLTLMSKPFLSVSNWAQMATASTFLLAAAAGLTLVLVIGEIDLSIGSIAYMAATVAFLMSDYPLVMTIAAALGVGLLTGLFNGWLVAYLGMNSLLTTLGLMIAYRVISLVFTEGTVKSSGEALAEIGRIKVASDVPLIFTVALFIVFLFSGFCDRPNLAPIGSPSAITRTRRVRSVSRCVAPNLQPMRFVEFQRRPAVYCCQPI